MATTRQGPDGEPPAGAPVGRRDEVAEVRRLLSTAPLVTLTGVGGVGKTQVALMVAAQSRDRFPDGVAVVDLAAVTEPDRVAAAVLATVSGARAVASADDQGRDPGLRLLLDHLATRRVLLVLDTCEHLVDAVAAVLPGLLRACPQVRVLATSRTPLAVPGELILPVLPLPVPDPDRPVSPRQLARLDALTLLRHRTRRPGPAPAAAPAPGNADADADADADAGSGARAGLSAGRSAEGPQEGPEQTPAAIRVCHELDGLPLAIELATARAGETEHLPERHRSAAACSRWSYQLCTPAEQLLWQRISVFHRGFDLDAVEAVCGGEDLLWPGPGGSGRSGPGYAEPGWMPSGSPEGGYTGGGPGEGRRGPGPDLLELTESLVERSVLIREEYRAGVWYRLLHTVGDFGRQQAAARTGEGAGEPGRLVAAAGGPRHGTAVLARRHRDWYLGLVRRGVGDGIGPRRPQWLARWDREHANLAAAVRYSLDHGEPDAAIDLLTGLEEWILGRRRRQGRAWLERALAGEAPAGPRLHARCLLAVLAAEAGDRVSAAAALAPCRAADAPRTDGVDPGLLATADGTVALVAGDARRALSRYREAADTFAGRGPVTWQLRALAGLTVAAALAGDHSAADAAVATALQVADRHGESWLRGLVLRADGLARSARGELPAARTALEQSLRANLRLDDLSGIAGSLAALGLVAGDQQDHRRAVVLLGAAENVARSAGVAVAGPAGRAGPAGQHRRALDEGRRVLGETAFRSARQTGRQAGLAELPGLAGLSGLAGLPDPVGVGVAADPLATEAPPGVPEGEAGLTPRELEVAELVAEGLTNRQIADRLAITPRTADSCLERIRAQLGVASRTQVAVWVVSRTGRDPVG